VRARRQGRQGRAQFTELVRSGLRRAPSPSYADVFITQNGHEPGGYYLRFAEVNVRAQDPAIHPVGCGPSEVRDQLAETPPATSSQNQLNEAEEYNRATTPARNRRSLDAHIPSSSCKALEDPEDSHWEDRELRMGAA